MPKYFYFILFVIFSSFAASWPLILDKNITVPCCGDTPPSNESTCALNEDFGASFDRASCSIVLLDVWDIQQCTNDVYISINNGDWISITPEKYLTFPGIKNCEDIKIALDENGSASIEYQGSIDCNCGPCTPAEIDASNQIDLVLANPMDHYLSADCCCSDYTFIFPDGTQRPALIATLHLRVEALNGRYYSRDFIDEQGKTIKLK